MGMGVCLRGSLHRRGLGPGGQGRRPLRCLQPVYDAVVDRWGHLDADIARGLSLRHDWGPQYRSAHFTGSLAWLGIADSPAFLGEPETNGCAERWIRTLKEQCLWPPCTTPSTNCARPSAALSTVTTAHGLSNGTAIELQRRPTRQHNQPKRHDRIDHEPVQGTGCCSLRIRSKARPVCPVLPWAIAAGYIGSAVRLVTSRPAPSQRPDCHRDCQYRRGFPRSAARWIQGARAADGARHSGSRRGGRVGPRTR